MRGLLMDASIQLMTYAYLQLIAIHLKTVVSTRRLDDTHRPYISVETTSEPLSWIGPLFLATPQQPGTIHISSLAELTKTIEDVQCGYI
jgi:hypothetical protein